MKKSLYIFSLLLATLPTIGIATSSSTSPMAVHDAGEVGMENPLNSPSEIADDLEAGKALYAARHYEEAKSRLEKALSSGKAEARLWLARIAWLNYDSAKALDLYSAYSKSGNSADASAIAAEMAAIRRADEMLKRVEDVVIIDSIVVDKSEFLKAYRLDPACGTLAYSENGVTFANEDNDFRISSAPDSANVIRLMYSERLTDGKWSPVEPLDTNLNREADALYPFMMPDGITLYFASNSDQSIGGLDIFTAQRDPIESTFLLPRNLGFPYNSPADDYMMAIDEQTGAGWWASDRNLIPGKTTIFVFIPNESRRNCDPDSVDLMKAAQISSLIATQKGEDFSEVRERIKNLSAAGSPQKEKIFTLKMPGGKVYTNYSDFRNEKAKAQMKKYVAANARLIKAEDALNNARKEYHDNPSKSLANKILKHEDNIYDLRDETRRLLSEVYRCELGDNR